MVDEACRSVIRADQPTPGQKGKLRKGAVVKKRKRL